MRSPNTWILNIDRRSLGNCWSRNICNKKNSNAGPSLAAGMCVCSVWVCFTLQDYYVTHQWCNAVPGCISSWGANPPCLHLHSTKKPSWTTASADITQTQLSAWRRLSVTQSDSLFNFPCSTGLKLSLHLSSGSDPPKSAWLLQFELLILCWNHNISLVR